MIYGNLNWVNDDKTKLVFVECDPGTSTIVLYDPENYKPYYLWTRFVDKDDSDADKRNFLFDNDGLDFNGKTYTRLENN